MASTNPSATRKPANRMTAEIADYNGVPRSTQEHGTFKWTNRSWYAIEDKTPCDYLVKYKTRGVARGMIRFARLEAQTNAPISVGELAVRVAALQEAHDATALSGLVQAKMRLKIGRPWQRELIARGYKEGNISQLFWAKMEDGEGDEITVEKAPAKDEDSEEEDDEEMGEEIDVDEEQLSEGSEGNDNNVGNQASDDEQVQTDGYHEHEMDGEEGLVTKQRDDDEGSLEIELDTAADGEMDGMVIDEDMELDGKADVDERQPDSASQSSKGDANIEASDLQEMQVDRNDAVAEEMDIDEELMVEASKTPSGHVSIEADDTSQTSVKDSLSVEADEEMDSDLERIFNGEGVDENTDLADLQLLFPAGNW
ncbi:unnamed protein product [Zymoseptoria tritici ST99CH_3D7]|uniref:Uncharacterized protein n=1 Tax=Zymoseptoria tritici (strain ST99CH_3D7) TaxID=1276538 RepID=A0A1X7RZJ2_ZYMT9|nr:unnamed protein product [Zymoseptoria tritici ST99CH_3D7]